MAVAKESLFELMRVDASQHFAEAVLNTLHELRSALCKLIEMFISSWTFKFRVVAYRRVEPVKSYLREHEPWFTLSLLKSSRNLGYKGLVILCEEEEFDEAVLFEECIHSVLSFVEHPVQRAEISYEQQIASILAEHGVASDKVLSLWLSSFSKVLEDSLTHFYVFSIMGRLCEICMTKLRDRLSKLAFKVTEDLSKPRGDKSVLYAINIAPWAAVVEHFSSFRFGLGALKRVEVIELKSKIEDVLEKADLNSLHGLREARARITHLQLNALEKLGLLDRLEEASP